MAERDWVGLTASVLEEGVKALLPGSGPLVGLASKALEPEKEGLRQWRRQKSEQQSYLTSITTWARGAGIADADIEDGLDAAADMLRQKGAGMLRVAELNLDSRAIADEVARGDWQPQKNLPAR